MIWFFYNLLFAIGFLLMLPKFLLRMSRRGGYARDFTQRFGHYRPEIIQKLDENRRVWVHAVSVGEVYVALKLMADWRARRPGLRFVLTTNTSTGHAIAARQMDPRDVLLYFPMDVPWITRRVLDTLDPLALVLVELELWPNLVRLAHARFIPVILVNGRVSDHSFVGYSKLRFFTRRLLPLLDVLCVQTKLDAERLVDLGARVDRVRVLGTAKYDVATFDPSGETEARDVLRRAKVNDTDLILLGGSTWPGEEHALLDAFKGLKTRYRNLVLVLAPRHVERTETVLREIKDSHLSVVRRSELVNPETTARARPQVFLLDTTGELKNFYACADVIFVGKSLTQRGGQNPIEPALYGKPVVVGNHMENFRAVAEDMRAAEALVEVTDLQSLRRSLDDLLASPSRRRSLGEAAARVVRDKTGATARTLEILDAMLEEGEASVDEAFPSALHSTKPIERGSV
jgi:3-deoxy-D-manno-octulosonic-acid transferase